MADNRRGRLNTYFNFVLFRIESDLSVVILKKRNIESFDKQSLNQSRSSASPASRSSNSASRSSNSASNLMALRLLSTSPGPSHCSYSNAFLTSTPSNKSNESTSPTNPHQNLIEELNLNRLQSETEDDGPHKREIESDGLIVKSRRDLLARLDANFVDIVVQGLDSAKRGLVRESISNGVKLASKLYKAAIASINHELHSLLWSQRPDASLCWYSLYL